MPARRTMIAAACAVAAAGSALTGCDDGKDKGSAPLVVPVVTTSAKAEPFADLTASQLLKKAEKDMRDAGAMTYDVTGTDSGSTMRLKAAITTKGACAAAMEMDDTQFQLIVPGGPDTYLKGDKAFWRQNADADAARLFAGKWVKIPESEYGSDSDLTSMCDLDSLMDSLAEGDGAAGTTLTRGAPVTQGGKQVIPLTQSDGDGVVKIFVSTGATPYVVRSEDRTDDPPDVATFYDFGKQPDVAVPPRAQTVDPKDLGPSGGLHL